MKNFGDNSVQDLILNGSAAIPSLAFVGSYKTGLFRKSANVIGFSVNGTEVGSWAAGGLALVTPLDVTSGGTGRATSTTAYGVLCAGTTATGAHQTIASVGTTGQVLTSNGPGALPSMQDIPGAVGVPVGSIQAYAGVSTPAGWLLCDGSSVSRATYAALWAALSVNKGAATTAIASPGVVTNAGHQLGVGDAVSFTTTGALPTGLTAGTTYYVIAAGLTANDFRVAATQGGAAINFTGSTSGVHTLYHNPYGTPAASTINFLLPDLRGRAVVGKDDMGGVAANRMTSTGSGIYGSAQGSVGGNQTHTLTTAQIPAHTHDLSANINGGGQPEYVYAASGAVAPVQSGSTGGGAAHNNTQPSAIVNFIIKT